MKDFYTRNTMELVGFEFLTAGNMKMAVLWVLAPCGRVEVYQRPTFRMFSACIVSGVTVAVISVVCPPKKELRS